MAAAAGRAWGWLRSWTGGSDPHQRAGRSSWTSWMWGGRSGQGGPGGPVEEFWEAPERIQRLEAAESRWWSRFLWPSLTRRGGAGWRDGAVDGDLSDYGTPPPSPTPPSPPTSPFRLFVPSWTARVLPEHHHICFNFLRHLFDLLVVGFLWTASPPAQLVLEVLGVQGPLRLWLHGMAMFLVSTVGMGGLLWLVQEYLPHVALVYGVVQAAVISVSVRQSVMLGLDGDGEEDTGDGARHRQDQTSDGEDQPASEDQDK